MLVDLSLASSGKKTTDDHMLSSITGYDCKVRRILKEGLEAVCVSLKPNFMIPEEKQLQKRNEWQQKPKDYKEKYEYR